MQIESIVTLVVTVIVALAGWLLAHFLTSKRDLANKRRELRTEYLLEAYRKLEGAALPRNPEEKWQDLESAIADLQLLGTPSQVEMAKEFAEGISSNGNADLDNLLFDLRATLRGELKLEPVSSRIKYLRFGQKHT